MLGSNLQNKEASKYEIFCLAGFHIIYLLHLFNSDLIRPQFVFAYLLTVSLLNFKLVISNIAYFLFFLKAFTIGVLCLVLKGFQVEVFYALCYFFSLFIVVQFYSSLLISNKLHVFLMSGYFLYVVFLLVIRGIDPNQILSDRSQNMVGFYYLCFVILYYFENFKYGKRLNSIIPALSSVIFSLLLFGRSSIIVSILLLIVIIFFNLKNSNSLNKFKIFILLFFTICLSIIYFNSILSGFLEVGLSRFGKEGTDLTGRSEIWDTYLKLTFSSLKNLLFGVRLDADYIFLKFDGNLHNSYLIAHSFFGLYCFYLFYILLKSLKFKNNFALLSCIIIILLIRGFTDGIFFVNYNDYILFSIVFFITPLKRIRLWKK